MKFTASRVEGALARMMGSGIIVDFELKDERHEFGSELMIRIWVNHSRESLRIREYLTGVLPSDVEERHVTIVEC